MILPDRLLTPVKVKFAVGKIETAADIQRPIKHQQGLRQLLVLHQTVPRLYPLAELPHLLIGKIPFELGNQRILLLQA